MKRETYWHELIFPYFVPDFIQNEKKLYILNLFDWKLDNVIDSTYIYVCFLVLFWHIVSHRLLSHFRFKKESYIFSFLLP